MILVRRPSVATARDDEFRRHPTATSAHAAAKAAGACPTSTPGASMADMTFLEAVVGPAVAAASVALILLGLLYVGQRGMLYFPGPAVPGAEVLPPRGETVELRTEDGLRLAAWFLPASGATRPQDDGPRPGPAVL